MDTFEEFLKRHSVRTLRNTPVERRECPPCVGVITSGGDSPGMNPAVRAIVRGALHQGYRVYGIRDGYRGLCRGEDEDIIELTWISVSGIIHKGGTFLGTARCEDFRQKEGRKKVVHNLISRGINTLIIVGGDGSLTGASILHKEWPEYISEILSEMSDEEKKNSWVSTHWKGREEDMKTLQVVGLVGSIDNDMGKTAMTIGCDTALHRICNALDVLSSTAASHHRVFVVEVMGRKCGWLAQKAAVACGAEYVFIPENPAPTDWREEVVATIKRSFMVDKSSAIVIIAEGAQDTEMKPITAEQVRKVLQDSGADTRVTILGHVQRGGAPSFYDRAHSMILGYAAVQEMVKGSAKKEPQLICVDGLFDAAVRPVAACLTTSQNIMECIENQRYSEAMKLRGQGFIRAHEVMLSLVTSKREVETQDLHNIAIFHVGACSPGMNAVARAFVRLSLDKGFTTYGVCDGISGLEEGEFHKMSWGDVNGWAALGGAKLGTSRFSPSKMDIKRIAESLEKYNIKTLAMIGGWDGYRCMLHLKKNSKDIPYLQKLNVLLVPCTISNNLPCTQYSIGADTALNSIVDAVDKIKESAIAQRRIFVIEVMGAYCGFLCAMGAFATGAEKTFCPEYPLSLETLQTDLADVKESFQHDKPMALFFTTEKTSKVFDTKFLAKLFKSQSEGDYDVRVAILGHLQQGGSPSPMDRFLSVEIVGECIKNIEEYSKEGKESLFKVVGLQQGKVVFSEAEEIEKQTDMSSRRPKEQWWTSSSFAHIALQYAEWKEKPEVYSTK